MSRSKHSERSAPTAQSRDETPTPWIGALIWVMAALIAIALSSLMALEACAQQAPTWGTSLLAPSLQTGRVMDGSRALPLTRFYDAPSQTAAEPGALVRAESATDFVLPPGVTATRILYHTRTANGTDTLSSGVVLLPYGQPPKGGWPLLAWSHGTSGVARTCAPSLMKSLFYNWEGLYQYVTLGYAVVATDYAGLGTVGPHAYLDIHTNANDVINSIPAAHAAVPDLSRRWLVVGHSQGGLSSLGVSELEANIKDPNFLGTVALAGASDLADAVESVQNAGLPVLNGLIAFWIYGVKAIYPEFQPKDVLSSEALSIYEASVVDGCSAASGAFAMLPAKQILLPGWRDNPYIKRFFERNRPGAHSTYGPLLLVGGGDDILFTEAAERKIVERICAAGGRVQQKIYPGLGHDALVYGSLKDQLEWIAQRFRGESPANECHLTSTTKTVPVIESVNPIQLHGVVH